MVKIISISELYLMVLIMVKLNGLTLTELRLLSLMISYVTLRKTKLICVSIFERMFVELEFIPNVILICNENYAKTKLSVDEVAHFSQSLMSFITASNEIISNVSISLCGSGAWLCSWFLIITSRVLFIVIILALHLP